MTDFRVLIPAPTMPLIVDALAARFTVFRLWEEKDEAAFLREQGGGIRALAGGFGSRRADAALMARLPSLQIVANFGVGYDGVDADWAGRHGVVVTNTPDVLTDEVADLAMGLLLSTIRRLPQADRHLREGLWPKGPYPLTATLRGRKMGILGLGRIGKAIGKRAEAFGLGVSYHGRNRQPDVSYTYHPSVVEMARAVDILMVVTPGGAGTDKMVDAAVLQALGPEGVLINVARGSVVDEAALIEALRTKAILSAGLDVFENEPHAPPELIAMDHVVLLPHVGSASVETRRAMGQLVVDNVISFSEGRGPLTPVPETPWPATKRSAS